jgi:RNA recognition motif-containing protein
MPKVTEKDTRSLFERHGAVQCSKLMTDRWTGLSRGFGFIQMKTDAQAEGAIVALNGTDLNGKILKVNPARLQLHRRTGSVRPSAGLVAVRDKATGVVRPKSQA